MESAAAGALSCWARALRPRRRASPAARPTRRRGVPCRPGRARRLGAAWAWARAARRRAAGLADPSGRALLGAARRGRVARTRGRGRVDADEGGGAAGIVGGGGGRRGGGALAGRSIDTDERGRAFALLGRRRAGRGDCAHARGNIGADERGRSGGLILRGRARDLAHVGVEQIFGLVARVRHHDCRGRAGIGGTLGWGHGARSITTQPGRVEPAKARARRMRECARASLPRDVRRLVPLSPALRGRLALLRRHQRSAAAAGGAPGGKGARYTRGRGPLRVVYQEACGDRSAALRREHAVKKLSREAKLRLVAGHRSKARERARRSRARAAPLGKPALTPRRHDR